MRSILLATVAVVALSSGAVAADAVAEFPVASTYNWSGAYVGAQVGYGWGNAHQGWSSSGDYSNPDANGWLGGVYAGYNYQFDNNVVLGVDADFAWSGADGNSLFYHEDGAPYSDIYNSNLDMKWNGAARVRLGYAVDRFLPYIAGGVAFARAEWTYTDNLSVVENFADTFVGWTIGAGAEYAFTDNLIGRAEYRYTDFGSKTGPSGLSVDLKTNDFRLGIAYKF